MSADRGAFICQSQSLNLFVENPNFGKLSSMHFYAWKSGLKTGMYYLRTKSAVDAIKFTLDNKKKEKPVATTVEVAEDNAMVEKRKAKAAKTAATFVQETTEVEPMTAEEMKALIAQAKEAEGDDCLMCGS